MSTAIQSYVDAAAEVGALHGAPGAEWVGGEQTDPVRGHSAYLVTYCAPALAGDPGFAADLVRVIRAEAPQAREVLLRLPAAVRPDHRWRPERTYIRHDGSHAVADTTGLVTAQAGAAEEPAVLGWLTDAIAEAANSWDWPLHEQARTEAAHQVLTAPGRISFVAADESGPIGHATLLAQEYDEVTGEDFAELFDVLVTPGHPRHRQAVALLTACATEHARASAIPLLGNVVHPAGPQGQAHADRVLGALASSGWRPDHVFWTCEVARLAEPPR